MRLSRCFIVLVLLGVTVRGHAEAPRVITDIAPVHSLVSQVMGELGTARVLVSGNASAHDFALRPSVAASIASADIVIRVSDELTPWLDTSVRKLAPDLPVLSLIDVDGVKQLPARVSESFLPEHSHHGHAIDPHAWLDPDNAHIWLDAIAHALSQLDPEHAPQYTQNATVAKTALIATQAEIASTLSMLGSQPFLIFHDSIQYFERSFGLPAAGSIAAGDASRPGPARVERVRRMVKEQNISCVLSEPQFNPELIQSVTTNSQLRVVTIDILGSRLSPGPELYSDSLLKLAVTLAHCLR